MVVVGIKLPLNKTITVSAGCLNACEISRRIVSEFCCFGNIRGRSKRRYVRGVRCTQKHNDVIGIILRCAQIRSTGEIATAHSVSELNGNACGKNFFDTILKVSSIDLFNSVQNGNTLLALGEATNVLVDFHCFIVLAFVEQLIGGIVADKRNNQGKEQHQKSCQSNHARNADCGGFFSLFLVCFCFEVS